MNRYDIALNKSFDRDSAMVQLLDVLHQVEEKKKWPTSKTKDFFMSTFQLGNVVQVPLINRNLNLWPPSSPRFAHLPNIQTFDETLTEWHGTIDYRQFRPTGEPITPEIHGNDLIQEIRPCTHPGCQLHVTHPCEVCGRQWGKP